MKKLLVSLFLFCTFVISSSGQNKEVLGKTNKITKVNFGYGFDMGLRLNSAETVHIVDSDNKYLIIDIQGDYGKVKRSNIIYNQDEIKALEVYRKSYPLAKTSSDALKKYQVEENIIVKNKSNNPQIYNGKTTLPFPKLTSGDYLIKSGSNYLYGIGLGIAGGAFFAYGASAESQEFIWIGSVSALTGFICTIVAHTELIKAGKAMKKEHKISFYPASSGIGLALKF